MQGHAWATLMSVAGITKEQGWIPYRGLPMPCEKITATLVASHDKHATREVYVVQVQLSPACMVRAQLLLPALCTMSRLVNYAVSAHWHNLCTVVVCVKLAFSHSRTGAFLRAQTRMCSQPVSFRPHIHTHIHIHTHVLTPSASSTSSKTAQEWHKAFKAKDRESVRSTGISQRACKKGNK